MIGYINKLGQLSFIMNHELSVDLVLQSLPKRFSQFIMNYHMNKLDNTLPELFNILKTIERAFKKEKDHVLLIQFSSMSKKKNKKNKGSISKAKKATRGIKRYKCICDHYSNDVH